MSRCKTSVPETPGCETSRANSKGPKCPGAKMFGYEISCAKNWVRNFQLRNVQVQNLLRWRVNNNLDNPQFLLEKELSFLHLLKSFNLYEGWSRISEESLPVRFEPYCRSDRVAERRLALPTSDSDHGVSSSSPAGGKIISEPKRRFIAQSFSCSPFHRPDMNEILLKRTLNRNSSIDPLSPTLQMISVYILLTNIPVLGDSGTLSKWPRPRNFKSLPW